MLTMLGSSNPTRGGGPAGDAEPAPNAGRRRVPCAARLWLGHRRLGRSPRVTPTTVVHPDGRDGAASRSVPATISWSGSTPALRPTARAAAQSSVVSGVEPPHRHGPGPGRRDNGPGRRCSRSPDRSCLDADGSAGRSERRTRPDRSPPGSLHDLPASMPRPGACGRVARPQPPARPAPTRSFSRSPLTPQLQPASLPEPPPPTPPASPTTPTSVDPHDTPTPGAVALTP